MGLDMYLTKKTYLRSSLKTVKVLVIVDDEPSQEFDSDKITSITEDVFSWRKANQIHNWFVNTIQEGNDDSREYLVHRSDLEDLKNLCKEVLENKDKAPELLPTYPGFFFGSTDYDEYYFQDVEETYDFLRDELKNFDKSDVNYYYQSSW